MRFYNADYHYGFHATKHPSMMKTISDIVNNTPLSAMQIYISNSRAKCPPTFNFSDLFATRKLISKNEYLYVVIHGCLLYNLAGSVGGKSDDHYSQALISTLQCLTAELDFGVALGNVGVVVHPGSRKDDPIEGLKCVSESIVACLTKVTFESEKIASHLGIKVEEVIKRRKIILENAAGEGTKLCSTLEEIRDVILGVPFELRNQVKVCIDTAHGFGKGLYDWGLEGEIDRFYKDFQEIIGLEHLELFHLNDSKVEFGSKKDRHEQLGYGYIFTYDEGERFKQIRKFLLEAKKHGIKIIGEPPECGVEDWHKINDLLQDSEEPLSYAKV